MEIFPDNCQAGQIVTILWDGDFYGAPNNLFLPLKCLQAADLITTMLANLLFSKTTVQWRKEEGNRTS